MAYTVSLILVLAGFLFTRYFYFKKGGVDQTEYTLKIALLKSVVNCGTAVVTLIASAISSKDKEEAIDALRTSGIGVPACPAKWTLSSFYTLLILLLLALDMYIYDSLPYLELIWGFYVSYLVNNACVEQFIGYTRVLRDAFAQIHEWVVEPTKSRMEVAVLSFERVTAAAEHLNEAFGIQLLLIVGSNFLLSTINAYLIVSEEDLDERLLFILWGCSSAMYPLRIVYALDHVKQQTKVKLHVAMKKELEFTARGFFTLDYGLINSMLGAVTTYLVILMQFQTQK